MNLLILDFTVALLTLFFLALTIANRVDQYISSRSRPRLFFAVFTILITVLCCAVWAIRLTNHLKP